MSERFELLEELGRGGMGVVWRARNRDSGAIVAIKRLHAGFEGDPEFVQRFEREVEVTRRVQSPHVVRVLGFGVSNGAPFLEMELVEGRSLREIIRERGRLPWTEVRDIGRQVALGLQAAHAEHVIHRDVKPSNILVMPDGTVKLADFGIARAGDLTRLTLSQAMMGTPPYMSPDSVEDEQSDLYSLGCVLHEALSGQPPFTATTYGEYYSHHRETPPDLSKLPPEARPVIGWLLQKQPANRPPSAAALAAVLTGTATPPRNTQRFVAMHGRPKRRFPVATVAALALVPVVAGASVLAVLAMGGGDDDGASTPDPSPTVRTLAAIGGAGGGSVSTVIVTATPTPTLRPVESRTSESATPTWTLTATPSPSATPVGRSSGVSPTATYTPTSTPTRTHTPTPTWTPSPTPTRTPTPVPVVTQPPSYTVQAWLDRSSYTAGDTITMCYRLFPEGTPYRIDITQTSPTTKFMFSQDDNGIGAGDCIPGPSGTNHVPYFELTVEFFVNGMRVGSAVAGAPVNR